MLAPVASAVCFVFAILFAKGWVVDTSIANAVALIAAGLLVPLLFGVLAWTPRPRPPSGRDT